MFFALYFVRNQLVFALYFVKNSILFALYFIILYLWSKEERA